MSPPLLDLAAERLAALLDAERENTALRAEVARLRVINADLRRMVDGLETAAHEERAAVVSYLRGLADDYGVCLDLSLDEQADIIERGEHRRKEEP
jgi:hypothetical protein